MTDFTWPRSFAPSELKHRLKTSSVVFVNPFNGRRQILERMAAVWYFKIVIPAFQNDWMQEIEGIVAGLNGPVNSVRMPFWPALPARGELQGTPSITGKNNSKSLILSGCTPDSYYILRRGDYIQTSPGRVHMVTAPVHAIGTATTAIPIEPFLRENPVTQTLAAATDTTTMTIRMQLTGDNAVEQTISSPRKSNLSLEFIENLDQIV